MNFDEKIAAKGWTNVESITDELINPFVEMPLTELKFGAPRIQNSQVFYSNFSDSVQLTTMN